MSVRIYTRLGRNVGMSFPLRDVLRGWGVILLLIYFGVRSCFGTQADEVAAARSARAHARATHAPVHSAAHKQ